MNAAAVEIAKENLAPGAQSSKEHKVWPVY